MAVALALMMALATAGPCLFAATPAVAATPAAPAVPTTGVPAPPSTFPSTTPPTTPPTSPVPMSPPAPTPTTSGSGGGGGGLFGWLSGVTGLSDVPGIVANAVNSWLTGLAQDAAEPVLRLLGHTLLSTPDVTTDPRVRELWAGSLLIADSLFLLVLTVGAIAVMGEDLVHHKAMAREYAPRMAIAFGMAHLSLPLMSQGITLSNALEKAIVGQQVTGDGITSLLYTTLIAGRTAPVYLVLLFLGVVGLAIGLVIGWITRMIIMMVLAVAAPLMLLWHGLPWTEAVAAIWWRALAGCLAIQTGQALLLLVGVRVLLSADGRPTWMPSTDPLVNTLTAAALFYLAIRLQGWVVQLVLRSTGGGRSALKQIVQYRMLRRALSTLTRA